MNRQLLINRLVAPAIGLVVLLCLTTLYVTGSPVYLDLLSTVSIAPMQQPFIDWAWIPSAAECWDKGVDVYVNNTCYPYLPNSHHNYSPLLLRFHLIPNTVRATQVGGLCVALAYVTTLAFLPSPRNGREIAGSVLVAVSSLSVFTIERGNLDILILVTIAVAVALWRGPILWRGFAYALFMLLAMMKYYPLVLLTLALRERPRMLLAVAATCILALAAFVVAFGNEIRVSLQNLPPTGYFFNMIGAKILPFGTVALLASRAGGLLALLGPVGPVLGRGLPIVLFGGLLVAAFGTAWWLFAAGGVRLALRRIAPWPADLLVAGAAVLCPVFFVGISIGYRGVLLVLVMPGLLRLAGQLPRPAARRVVAFTCVAVVLVSWARLIETTTNRFTQSGSLIRGAHWAANELMWWWIIATLLAVLFSFVADSPSLQSGWRLLRGLRKAAG